MKINFEELIIKVWIRMCENTALLLYLFYYCSIKNNQKLTFIEKIVIDERFKLTIDNALVIVKDEKL